MNEELKKQDTPITAPVEQKVVAVEPEELSEEDLEVVAGGNGLNCAG